VERLSEVFKSNHPSSKLFMNWQCLAN